MNANNKLVIGAFYDGRPGHEKQTRGIVRQLQAKIPMESVAVAVPSLTKTQQAGQWLHYLGALPSDPEWDLARCGVLLGTGTQTHLAMLRQKKHFGIPTVTCMTPAFSIASDFDLIFAPQHDNVGHAENIFTTIGPPGVTWNKTNHLPERVLVLIGGPAKNNLVWRTDHIVESVTKIARQNLDKVIVVSSSPRTPLQTVAALTTLADEFCHLYFYDYRQTPNGWVEQEYDRCAQVWVTGDSMSMMYEALSSGCRVGLIPVQWRRTHSKYIRSEQYLKKQGFIVDLHAYLHGIAEWKNETQLNEASRCADEIIRRFT
ncbi:MAG: ELM1/GtrOC1 family putative glycosyltransferase [Desulfopila sp.]